MPIYIFIILTLEADQPTRFIVASSSFNWLALVSGLVATR